MSNLTLIESERYAVTLTESQALELTLLGRRLAAATRASDDDEENRASVIRCTLVARDRWQVSVDNAVGVIAIDGLQITVEPKIPLEHLVFLLEKARLVPRLDRRPIEVASSTTLLQVVAKWFLYALEVLFRDDLLHDYREERDELGVLRGDSTSWGRSNCITRVSRGSRCSFEEYDADTALNRILKAGAEGVAANAAFSDTLRRRFRLVARRFLGVGLLQHGDLNAKTDRRTAEYADAVMLAKCLLGGESRSIEVGDIRRAWVFLLPTPFAVQHALTRLLSDALADFTTVKAVAIPFDRGMTANPDLVFRAFRAVGDVKYKRIDGRWKRSDLYQVVAFAALLDYTRASILTFAKSDADVPGDIDFGRIRVRAIAWRADPAVSAAAAARRFCDDVTRWLTGQVLPE